LTAQRRDPTPGSEAGEPIGPDTLRRIAEAGLGAAGGQARAEVTVIHQWGGLTRFASSSIHQSTWGEDTGVRVRVVRDGRTGVAGSNDLSPAGAVAAARSAAEMAEVSTPDPLFPGLAPAAPVPDVAGRFDAATAATTPEERAAAVRTLAEQCPDGFRAAGAYETSAAEVALLNSEGQWCYGPWTQASLTTVVSGGEGGAGFAEVFRGRAADVDAEAVGRRAADKAVRSQRPRDVDPGEYEVVLEPSATSTLLGFLAYLGFGGRALLEGRSTFSGLEGQTVGSPLVSISDDGLAPDTLGLAFDFEGTPKQRVDLIRDGVFEGAVWDRRSAREAGDGRATTGHALPPPNPEGPFPLNLFMATGEHTVDDMVAATKRGLLVTRFHYSNVVHPRDAVITGMTRDGLWLIEDGEVRHPVKNLRFTQSILETLKATDMVGREAELASEFFFAASRVPALRSGVFRFTGRSDH
jgi:predicted Zn-dependent protease